MYQVLTDFLSKYFRKDQIFKYGFNISPMYRRSCGWVRSIAKDLYHVEIVIKLSYRNKNYVGAMFGGSMYAATDPIYMIQLLQILGKKYVVWDKAGAIRYKRPAYQNAKAVFTFEKEEIESIRKQVIEEGEVDVIKHLDITNEEGKIIFATLEKTMYVATKEHYKKKLAARS